MVQSPNINQGLTPSLPSPTEPSGGHSPKPQIISVSLDWPARNSSNELMGLVPEEIASAPTEKAKNLEDQSDSALASPKVPDKSRGIIDDLMSQFLSTSSKAPVPTMEMALAARHDGLRGDKLLTQLGLLKNTEASRQFLILLDKKFTASSTPVKDKRKSNALEQQDVTDSTRKIAKSDIQELPKQSSPLTPQSASAISSTRNSTAPVTRYPSSNAWNAVPFTPNTNPSITPSSSLSKTQVTTLSTTPLADAKRSLVFDDYGRIQNPPLAFSWLEQVGNVAKLLLEFWTSLQLPQTVQNLFSLHKSQARIYLALS